MALKIYHPDNETPFGVQLFLTEGKREAESFAMALGRTGLVGYPLEVYQPDTTRKEALEQYGTFYKTGPNGEELGPYVDTARWNEAHKARSPIVWSVHVKADPTLALHDQDVSAPDASIRDQLNNLEDVKEEVHRNRGIGGTAMRLFFRATTGLRGFGLESRGEWVAPKKPQTKKR